MKRALLLLSFTAFLSGPVHAGESSQNVFYPVKGRSAEDIYNFIRTSSPRVEKGATFAFTRIATKTDSKLKKADGSCGYARFKTSAIYMFNLPQHIEPSQLSGGLRTKWQNFVQYLLEHEKHHRDMWRQCFVDYDTAALQLSAPDCESLDSERDTLFNSIKKRCVAQDEAFDVIFRKQVRSEPFVKEATSRKKQDGTH